MFSRTGPPSSSPRKKKGLWRRIIKWILLTISGLLILMTLIIGLVLNIILTPAKVTPVVLELANQYLEAEVDCESVGITFFSTFPDLGIVLEDGQIFNPVIDDGDEVDRLELHRDTLVAFRKCVISFNPVEYFVNKKIIIRGLKLEKPAVYAFAAANGKKNWDILPQADTLQTDTAKTLLPELDIKGIRISEGRIIYDDRQQHIFTFMDSLYLAVDGNMSRDSARIDLLLGMKGLSLFYDGQAMVRRLPLEVKANLMNNRITHTLSIGQAGIRAGVLGFESSGTIRGDSVSRTAEVDIAFKLAASSLSGLLEMMPRHIVPAGDKILAAGEVDFNGRLEGSLGKNIIPVLTASVRLKDGSLRSVRHPDKSGLKKIDIDIDSRLDMTGQTPSYMDVGNVFLQSASSVITCSGTFRDIFTRPYIDADVSGDINFNRMAQDLPFTDSLKMGGFIRMNISGKFFLDDVLARNFGKINAAGTMDVDDIIFRYPAQEIDFFASSAHLRLGSNVKDSIRGRAVESLFRGSFELDSIHFGQGSSMLVDMNKLTARFHTSAPKDTATIAVLATTASVENFRLNMGDSIRARAVKTSAMLSMVPSSDPSKPELSARIRLESLRGRTPDVGGRINQAAFRLKLKEQAAWKGRGVARGIRTDSVTRIRRQDSIASSYMSLQLSSDKARKIFRNLDVSGSFECKNASLRTLVFPLPVVMEQSSLDFTSNSLLLTNTRLRTGDSDMVLNGEIKGIRGALLRNRQLTAKLSIESNSVDFNQLIRTFVSGSEYGSRTAEQRDSIAQVVLDDTKELTTSSDSTTGIFVIPANIDFELDASMKKVKYSNLLLDNVSGKIMVRNQSVHLPGLKLDSDVGDALLSMVYKARDLKSAHLGMDLQMNGILIKELIGAFPMIDTLAPMLRSFEGVVDCNMTAMTELDSLSNVLLPKTTASCYVSGKDMVLLDGETFTEISKMLMFKNKKRNMIDSLSVEMILEDNKLMVFPFRLSIDRYVVAVGGTQNLDMSFDYHITVLKSPLPFKLGLNLSGSPDKIKFKLAKAKYKDMFSPAKEKSLASVQINLRQEMQESLRKSIINIIDEPLDIPVRRPRIALDDSLRSAFFRMDTTEVVEN